MQIRATHTATQHTTQHSTTHTTPQHHTHNSPTCARAHTDNRTLTLSHTILLHRHATNETLPKPSPAPPATPNKRTPSVIVIHELPGTFDDVDGPATSSSPSRPENRSRLLLCKGVGTQTRFCIFLAFSFWGWIVGFLPIFVVFFFCFVPTIFSIFTE